MEGSHGSQQNPIITAMRNEQLQSLMNALPPAPRADHHGQYVKKPSKLYGQHGKGDRPFLLPPALRY